MCIRDRGSVVAPQLVTQQRPQPRADEGDIEAEETIAHEARGRAQGKDEDEKSDDHLDNPPNRRRNVEPHGKKTPPPV